jgi:DNA-binding response OmpR family regulator
MLTALDDDRDKIEWLELGAGDYLTEPFNPDELVARVRAILRRARPPTLTKDDNVVTLGAARLDLAARRLTVGNLDVPLRPREFDLLVALAVRLSHVHSRDRLLQRVWVGAFDGDIRTVDVDVSRLREKLAPVGLGIETVRSVGYRLLASPR